jgi:hypothetical protein
MNQKLYTELKELVDYINTDTFQKHVCDILKQQITESNDIQRCTSWEDTLRRQGRLEGLSFIDNLLTNAQRDISEHEIEHS